MTEENERKNANYQLTNVDLSKVHKQPEPSPLASVISKAMPALLLWIVFSFFQAFKRKAKKAKESPDLEDDLDENEEAEG